MRSEEYHEFYQVNNVKINVNRVIILGTLMLAIFVYYLFYLFFMQVVDLDVYEKRADLVTKRNQIIPAKRGSIFDRNFNNPMASNFDTFTLTLNPEAMTVDEVNETVQKVADLTGLSLNNLRRKLPKGTKFYQPIELSSGLSYASIVKIAENTKDLPSVTWQSRPVRSYPLASITAHLLGYVGEITPDELQMLFNRGYTNKSIIGKDGIEKKYDELLRGKDGVKFKRVDAQGRGIGKNQEIIIPPEIGRNLILSIDNKIQELSVKALGNRIGSVIVMKPNSGEVLAMVSYPTYNPNLFYGEQAMDVFSRLSRNSYGPFFNRAIQSAASPASTFKVVLSAAILDTGLYSSNKNILCSGSVQIGNRKFHCHVRTGHGNLNLAEALAESCNVYFYTIGNDYLGVDRIVDYSYRFGFGELTGIDIPGEISGIVPTPEWKQEYLKSPWVGGDTVNLSIGQGFLQVTPIQLANMVSMIVNDGVSYQPHLLKEIRDPISNQVIEEIQPKILKQSKFNPGVLNELKSDMRGVILNGTAAPVMTTKSVQIAGKTGTAQTGRGEDDQHSWFVSYAPYDYKDPDDVVSVVVWVDAVNEWEWWAPKAANIIYHGIFSDMNYEETVEDLQPLWYLNKPEEDNESVPQ